MSTGLSSLPFERGRPVRRAPEQRPEGKTDDPSAGPGPCNAALEYKSRPGASLGIIYLYHIGTLH